MDQALDLVGSHGDKFHALIRKNPITALPDETLRDVVNRMAESGLTRLPVVDRKDRQKLLGIISLTALLHARARNLEEERRRQRVLRLRHLFRPETNLISAER